ncbi:MAG: AAA-associated domain-containing protein [Candidatus Micrarchaeaceae archaeon]
MPALFPIDAGITQMRGVLKIIKDGGGTIGIAELADEAEEEIDDLFPILDACKLLGLAKVNGGKVTITELGSGLTIKNMQKVLAPSLSEVEPFKTIILALKLEGEITTERLANLLKENNLAFYSDKHKYMEQLRRLLVKWAVRLRLLVYDQADDSWKLA